MRESEYYVIFNLVHLAFSDSGPEIMLHSSTAIIIMNNSNVAADIRCFLLMSSFL